MTALQLPLARSRTLAIWGGSPVRRTPLPAWPSYSEEEITAATECLRSGRVNQWTGSRVTEFQSAFADLIGVPYAVAVANGSLALELALRALEIGPGHDVIVPARSFVATAGAVRMVGATPVFCDVDYGTHVLTAAAAAPLVNARTKAIIPVHLYGRPCEMPKIMALARRHNLMVIEDCCQSHGASIGGRRAGSFGHASACSFCQDKIMTTGGEGGMLVLQDQNRWKYAWSFKDHGKDYDAAFESCPTRQYRWLHVRPGTNWRMLELQAAIGLVQLKRLSAWIERRAYNASRIAAALRHFPCVAIEPVPSGHVHAYYRLACTIDPKMVTAGWTRDEILRALIAEGVTALVGGCPEIYREAAYASTQQARLPNGARLGENALVFLTHPTLNDRALADYEDAIDKVFSVACRC